ncbi:MAG: hybrid sensor histidine kinase/response regulator [Prochlorothrix sp.]
MQLFHPVTSLRWLKPGEGHRSLPRLSLSHGLALGVLAWGCCLFSLLSLMGEPQAGLWVWMAEIGLGLGLGVLVWGYGAVVRPLAALVKALQQLDVPPPMPAPIVPPENSPIAPPENPQATLPVPLPAASPNLSPSAPNLAAGTPSLASLTTARGTVVVAYLRSLPQWLTRLTPFAASSVNLAQPFPWWVPPALEQLRSALPQNLPPAQTLSPAPSPAACTADPEQFLAHISHEMRSPLNAMLGLAQTLEESPLTPEQHHQVRVILGSGHYLLELINNILDLAKLDAGHTETHCTCFDLHALLQDVSELFRPQIQEKGLVFQEHWLSPLPRYVESDALKLRQILINLLSNAIKFTETGQITLSLAVINQGSLESVDPSHSPNSATAAAALPLTDVAPETLLSNPKREDFPGEKSAQRHKPLFQGQNRLYRHKTMAGLAHSPDGSSMGANMTANPIANLTPPHLGPRSSRRWDSSPRPALDPSPQPPSQTTDPRNPRGSVQYLWFSVQDTGIGIAAEELTTLLFQPFGQTASGRQSGMGTGLGLNLSRQNAKLLGGNIIAFSKLGQGSTFSVEIPITVPSQAPPMEPSRPDTIVPVRPVIGLAPDISPCRLLVVDDSPTNRLVLRQMLQPLALEVVEANNGQRAIEQWQQTQPDAILMDLQMPVLDGREAMRQIRSLPGGDRVKLIAVTAGRASDPQNQNLLDLCDDILLKPVNRVELLRLLAQNLGLRYRYGEAQQSA